MGSRIGSDADPWKISALFIPDYSAQTGCEPIFSIV